MKAVIGVLSAIRPVNALMAALAAITGAVVELGPGSDESLLWIILLSLSAVFMVGGANILNDIKDRKIDRIVHPSRAIASGRLTIPDAKVGFLFLWTSSIILTAIVSLAKLDPLPVLILLLSIFLVIIYETILKEKGAPGNVLIGMLTGIIFIYGGSPWKPGPLLFVLGSMAMLSTIAREIIKDIQDLHGEKKVRRTLPMIIGGKKAVYIAGGCLLAAVCVSVLPLLIFKTSIPYIVLVSLADIIMIVGFLISLNNPGHGQILIKTGMFVAIVGFFLYALI